MNFNHPYNRKEFTAFLLENFPSVNLKPEKIIIEKKSNLIKSIDKLGKSKDLELDIYEITHLSENDPRVLLSREAFSLMRDYSSHKALIIFKNDKTPNYRLSLITFQSFWETGKKVKVEFSSPRRYSFFLGPEAKINTPTKFLINKGKIVDFEDLKNRFSIEVVTKATVNSRSESSLLGICS